MARFGFLADDLTGASDVLAQAFARGLTGALVLDPEDLADAADVDVIGIAGPLRSLSGRELENQIRDGLQALGKLDLEVVLYKVCSTFDSSPKVGNIGRAIELIIEHAPSHGPIPVVPAQPEFGRYTVFSEHYGAYRGEVFRLDRHPVMAHHPSTPMAEADLRKVLAEQFTDGVEPPGLHLDAYSDHSFADRWEGLRRGVGPAFVVDAVDSTQMDAIADTLLRARPERGPAFVVGSGGIMAALSRVHGGQPPADIIESRPTGPTLVVSASASAVTASQIEDAVSHGWVDVAIPPKAFGASPENTWMDAVDAALSAGRNVVAHSSLGPADPRLASGASAKDVGGTIGRLAGQMARSEKTRDVIVCGGDTSSHALAAMNVRQLRIRQLFVTAGPICVADEGSDVAGCRLLLKGGQVGGPSLFRTFAGQLRER